MSARIFLVGGPACGNAYDLPDAPEEFNVALVPLARGDLTAPTAVIPVDLAQIRRAVYLREQKSSTRPDGALRYWFAGIVGG